MDVATLARGDVAAEMEGWPQQGTDEWEDEACQRLRITDASWEVIEDALDYRKHGTLEGPGGKGDQDARWWTLMRYAVGKLDGAEQKALERKGSKGRPSEDDLEDLRRQRRRRR